MQLIGNTIWNSPEIIERVDFVRCKEIGIVIQDLLLNRVMNLNLPHKARIRVKECSPVVIVYQQPLFADEVVVVFLNGEIVNDGGLVEGGDGQDSCPTAALRLDLLACNQIAGVDPVRRVACIAPRPERMRGRGPERNRLAFDAQLHQLVEVLRRDVCDSSQRRRPGLLVPRPDLVTHLDALDGNCAVPQPS